jgi:tetratricopeptide (TPR) repeat protein
MGVVSGTRTHSKLLSMTRLIFTLVLSLVLIQGAIAQNQYDEIFKELQEKFDSEKGDEWNMEKQKDILAKRLKKSSGLFRATAFEDQMIEVLDKSERKEGRIVLYGVGYYDHLLHSNAGERVGIPCVDEWALTCTDPEYGTKGLTIKVKLDREHVAAEIIHFYQNRIGNSQAVTSSSSRTESAAYSCKMKTGVEIARSECFKIDYHQANGRYEFGLDSITKSEFESKVYYESSAYAIREYRKYFNYLGIPDDPTTKRPEENLIYSVYVGVIHALKQGYQSTYFDYFRLGCSALQWLYPMNYKSYKGVIIDLGQIKSHVAVSDFLNYPNNEINQISDPISAKETFRKIPIRDLVTALQRTSTPAGAYAYIWPGPVLGAGAQVLGVELNEISVDYCTIGLKEWHRKFTVKEIVSVSDARRIKEYLIACNNNCMFKQSKLKDIDRIIEELKSSSSGDYRLSMMNVDESCERMVKDNRSMKQEGVMNAVLPTVPSGMTLDIHIAGWGTQDGQSANHDQITYSISTFRSGGFYPGKYTVKYQHSSNAQASSGGLAGRYVMFLDTASKAYNGCSEGENQRSFLSELDGMLKAGGPMSKQVYWRCRNAVTMEPDGSWFNQALKRYRESTAADMKRYFDGDGLRQDSIQVAAASVNKGWGGLRQLYVGLYPSSIRAKLAHALERGDAIDNEFAQAKASKDPDVYDAFLRKNPVNPYFGEVSCWKAEYAYQLALKDSTLSTLESAKDMLVRVADPTMCPTDDRLKTLEGMKLPVAKRSYNRGAVEFGAGDYATALQYLDDAVKLDNSRAEVFWMRGMAKAELKDGEGAKMDFMESGRRGTNALSVDSIIASAYKKSGRLDSSVVYQKRYQKVIDERRRIEEERIAEQKRIEKEQREREAAVRNIESKPVSSMGYVTTDEELCDDPNAHEGKQIKISVFYSSTMQKADKYGLRSVGEDMEKLNSMAAYGLNKGNDVYYTRMIKGMSVSCAIFLRIPYGISVPSINSGYIVVTGKVAMIGNNYSLIEVTNIVRQ